MICSTMPSRVDADGHLWKQFSAKFIGDVLLVFSILWVGCSSVLLARWPKSSSLHVRTMSSDTSDLHICHMTSEWDAEDFPQTPHVESIYSVYTTCSNYLCVGDGCGEWNAQEGWASDPQMSNPTQAFYEERLPASTTRLSQGQMLQNRWRHEWAHAASGFTAFGFSLIVWPEVVLNLFS